MSRQQHTVGGRDINNDYIHHHKFSGNLHHSYQKVFNYTQTFHPFRIKLIKVFVRASDVQP